MVTTTTRGREEKRGRRKRRVRRVSNWKIVRHLWWDWAPRCHLGYDALRFVLVAIVPPPPDSPTRRPVCASDSLRFQGRGGDLAMAVEAAGGRRGAAAGVRMKAKAKAKEAAVGAMARALFYPTLLYNVVRSKVQAEFRWWDEVDQFILLGAVPFRRDVPRLQKLGVFGVITLNEPFETLVKYKNMTPSTAFEHVRSKRARVLLTRSQWRVVQDFSKKNAEAELPTATSHSAAASPAGNWYRACQLVFSQDYPNHTNDKYALMFVSFSEVTPLLLSIKYPRL
uniref:Dual specificity protein phosphatase DSP8 n=1 Tax=Oryza punctata TaxID=4537 RepID=A0A0E0L7Y3_ORYPU